MEKKQELEEILYVIDPNRGKLPKKEDEQIVEPSKKEQDNPKKEDK